MKEQSGVINHTYFHKSFPACTCRTFSTASRFRLADLAQQIKKRLPAVLAGSGIGAIFITGAYLFLVQLAEHGF